MWTHINTHNKYMYIQIKEHGAMIGAQVHVNIHVYIITYIFTPWVPINTYIHKP